MEHISRNVTFSQFITEQTSVGKIEVCGVLDGSALKVISLADAESAFNEPNDPLIAQMKAFLAFVYRYLLQNNWTYY